MLNHRLVLGIAILWGVGTFGCSAAAPASGDGDQEPFTFQDPIVGGASDRGKDPAVVAIDIGGQGLCSGSLIGPRLVLTARHCVSKTAESVSCPTREVQVSGSYPADTFTILVGDDIRTATPVAIGKRVSVPASNQLCEHDLALIELDRAVSGVTPLALGSFSGVQAVRGVGFGKRGDTAASGQKMTRSNVPVLSSSATEFEVGVLSCSGDSGGPALDPKGRVVGVVSRGGPNCNGKNSTNVYTRVDAFHVLIEQALGNANGGAGASEASGAECGTGKRCPNGTHCNSSTRRCDASS